MCRVVSVRTQWWGATLTPAIRATVLRAARDSFSVPVPLAG